MTGKVLVNCLIELTSLLVENYKKIHTSYVTNWRGRVNKLDTTDVLCFIIKCNIVNSWEEGIWSKSHIPADIMWTRSFIKGFCIICSMMKINKLRDRNKFSPKWKKLCEKGVSEKCSTWSKPVLPGEEILMYLDRSMSSDNVTHKNPFNHWPTNQRPT